MLDLTQLARQMQGLSQHLTLEAAASRQRLELAQQHLKKCLRVSTRFNRSPRKMARSHSLC